MSSFTEEIELFLATCDLRPLLRVEQLTGGGNNAAYRVDTLEESYFLKHYYSHHSDKRDRLRNELLFYGFVESCGLDCTPKLVSASNEQRLALYTFISGKRPSPELADLAELLRFFQQLNSAAARELAGHLPLASEAYFTLLDHLGCVQRRIARLQQVAPESSENLAALEFINEKLVPCWQKLSQQISSHVSAADLAAVVPQAERCLSPSDFGFHNSLQTVAGRLYFFDFEYAGWDEPAKMLSDMFTQVASPISLDALPDFANSALATFPTPKLHLKRTSILLPVYLIKWCTIILNHFLPVELSRRSFAGETWDVATKKEEQLLKAKTTLSRVEEIHEMAQKLA